MGRTHQWTMESTWAVYDYEHLPCSMEDKMEIQQSPYWVASTPPVDRAWTQTVPETAFLRK